MSESGYDERTLNFTENGFIFMAQGSVINLWRIEYGARCKQGNSGR